MPIIKSARKRVKVAAKATARNVKTKRSLREALKAFAKAVESDKPDQVAKTHQAAMSAIDQAAKKAVMHKNKAARKKAQLSALLKAQGIKLTPISKTPKKPASVVKKASKKPAPKKKAS